MSNDEYEMSETNKITYIVYGFTSNGDKIFVIENGYNPYEWGADVYRYKVHFKDLRDAEHEADHAPKSLNNVTIERQHMHKITKTKIEKEIVEYKPKGLEPIIPF